MVLGLGTGSTVQHLLELLGEALAGRQLSDIVGVPTSERTASEARRLSIPLTSLEHHATVDLAIDGADEVAPGLDLIKGLGGALLREKMVVQAAERFVVIADRSKRVDRLGTRSPVPVEVVPFQARAHVPWLTGLGARVVQRMDGEGRALVTDNGNLIFDCWFDGGMADPPAIATALERRAGVVEHGLFLGLTHRAYVAGSDAVEELDP